MFHKCPPTKQKPNFIAREYLPRATEKKKKLKKKKIKIKKTTKKQRKVHEPILHVIVNALSKTYVILAQFSTDLHIKHLVDPDAFILGI